MTALKDIMKDEWQEIIKDEKEQTARKLIKRGKMTFEEIAEDTGLTLSEVEDLAGVAMA